MNPTQPLTASHMPPLDALRGLAIVMVTLYRFAHLGPEDTSAVGSWLFPIFNVGNYGVDLFFVISGFLITGILDDAKGKDGYLVNFIGRRALRIFPLYYAVLAIAFFLFPLLGSTIFAPQAPQQAWLWLYGTNLYQTLQGSWCLGPFDHFWSLAVEEHFYLIWPFVVGFFCRATNIRICIGIIVAAVLGRVAWMVAGGNEMAPSVLTFFRADALAVGALIALVARDKEWRDWLVPVASVTALVTGLLLIPLLALNRRALMIPETLLAWHFGSLIVIAVSGSWDRWTGWLWNNGALQWISRYSYGMYVFQNLLIAVMAPLITSESMCASLGSILWGRLAYTGIMSALTLAVAMLSWHLFEQRFLGLKDYFVSPAAPATNAPETTQPETGKATIPAPIAVTPVHETAV